MERGEGDGARGADQHWRLDSGNRKERAGEPRAASPDGTASTSRGEYFLCPWHHCTRTRVSLISFSPSPHQVGLIIHVLQTEAGAREAQ